MRIDPLDRVAHDPAYQRLHLTFMIQWWSGDILPAVRNPSKAAAARQALARLS